MDQGELYLKRLIGQTFISNKIESLTVLPINGNGKEIYQVHVSLCFSNYILSVYNLISVLPDRTQLDDLQNHTVLETNEEPDTAEIIFEGGFRLIVDLRDEAYFGPEAMMLTGPDNFWVVWN